MKGTISLCFNGWLRGVDIDEVMEVSSGGTIVVTEIDAETVVSKLRSGEWMLSLSEALDVAQDREVEVSDYEVEQ